jgi:hypothetical protein
MVKGAIRMLVDSRLLQAFANMVFERQNLEVWRACVGG